METSLHWEMGHRSQGQHLFLRPSVLRVFCALSPGTQDPKHRAASQSRTAQSLLKVRARQAHCWQPKPCSDRLGTSTLCKEACRRSEKLHQNTQPSHQELAAKADSANRRNDAFPSYNTPRRAQQDPEVKGTPRPKPSNALTMTGVAS